MLKIHIVLEIFRRYEGIERVDFDLIEWGKPETSAFTRGIQVIFMVSRSYIWRLSETESSF